VAQCFSSAENRQSQLGVYSGPHGPEIKADKVENGVQRFVWGASCAGGTNSMPSGEDEIFMEKRLGRCESTRGMDADRIMTDGETDRSRRLPSYRMAVGEYRQRATFPIPMC